MTPRKGCVGMFHTMAGYKHIFVRNRLLHFVLVSFLPRQAGPNTVLAQAKAGTSAPTVSITRVSHDSETIGGEPELDLSTPDPEVSSVVFTFRPATVSQWMIHTVPVHVYVLEGTLTVEFQDGSYRSFHPGQGFLQCRSKWHAAEMTGRKACDLLQYFRCQGVPNVGHPASRPLSP